MDNLTLSVVEIYKRSPWGKNSLLIMTNFTIIKHTQVIHLFSSVSMFMDKGKLACS